MLMLNPNKRVYCAAFGHGHVTGITEDGKGAFVKFHGELGQELLYWRNGRWREVTEDTYYDLKESSRAIEFLSYSIERFMWAMLGGLSVYIGSHFTGF